MPLDPRRIKALFLAALDLADPADRPRFLDRQCGQDRELRDRLEELLAAHAQPAKALEQPLAATMAVQSPGSHDQETITGEPASAYATLVRTAEITDRTESYQPVNPPPSAMIGSVIAGRYKIRQEIGEGGMGSVFLAEQSHPVKRMVALKLIKPGMDSRIVLARFDSERQALAMMDHPHIAKVLDAGTTDSGRPFFVMDLVKGIPLTEYCDQHRLRLPERLALFRQVCSAVQHAHQKGIIHRDLKPSNILVESHDDGPVPKVIDFGLAKATSGLRLTEQSLFTAFGSVAGTPMYMAPEQADFQACDIDTRADIYALGVILYELLTGSTPIRRETIQSAAFDEMLRVVREVEPPTPSSRLSSSDALPSLAANRDIDPARLSRFVRGDLDWIVMKALAKERHRRYESAIGLAKDLERFINHEPVSAGPPSSAYRLRKFVRRHRPQVVAASLVLLALVGGVIGTTLGLIEARNQQGIAVKQRQIAQAEVIAREKARKAESDQRRRAEGRLDQLEKVNQILGSIFKDLNPKNAENQGKPLASILGERLDQATAEIEGEAIGDPRAVARMQMILGSSQLGLGYPQKAIGLFTKARATFTAEYDPNHRETLASMASLAASYYAAGLRKQSLKLNEQTLALRTAAFGPEDADTLASMHSLAIDYDNAGQRKRALELNEKTLALREAKLGRDHLQTLATRNNLAINYANDGQQSRALKLRAENLELVRAKYGTDHAGTLASMSSLAFSYIASGQPKQALKLREETLNLATEKLGLDHPDTILHMANLAASYNLDGQRFRAIELLEETVRLSRLKNGIDHPSTLWYQRDLANSYDAIGQRDRALKLHEETFKLRRTKLGRDDPHTLTSMAEFITSLEADNQCERALKLHQEMLELRLAKSSADHPDTITSRSNLAVCYLALGRRERAAAEFATLVQIQPDNLGFRYRHALLLALRGDRDAYLHACVNMLDRFGDGPGNYYALDISRACSLLPDAVAGSGAPLRLAEEAVAGSPNAPWLLYIMGLAEYRAGNFDRAIEHLTQSERNRTWNATILNWPVLAMAHHRLGHHREARQLLARSRRMRDQARDKPGAKGNRLREVPWWDRAEFELLLNEAEILLRENLPNLPDDVFAR